MMKYKVPASAGQCKNGCRGMIDCNGSCSTYGSEVYQLKCLSNAFNKECKKKLISKVAHGRDGWDRPDWTVEDIKKALIAHIEKGDPVDIANFAAFWWNRIS